MYWRCDVLGPVVSGYSKVGNDGANKISLAVMYDELWCLTWQGLSPGPGVMGRYPTGPAWEVALELWERVVKVPTVILWLEICVRNSIGVNEWLVPKFELCVQNAVSKIYPVWAHPQTRESPGWGQSERRSGQTVLQSLFILVLQARFQIGKRWSPLVGFFWPRLASVL